MPNRPIHSCIRCSNRKVKCDRQRPCSACVKHNVDCVFNPSEPPRKRHRRAKEQILADKILHYEAILQEKGIDPNKLPLTPNSVSRCESVQTPASPLEQGHISPATTVEVDPSHAVNKPQIVHSQGRSTVVENSLWTRVVEEFHDPEDALEGSSNEESDSDASEEIDFTLRDQPKSGLKSRHPSPDHIHKLLQVYTENVDPLTKILHLPTLRPAIQKAVANLENVPRSFEALMFAIYGVSIMTLNDQDCKDKFGESRKSLFSRYTSSTKTALSRARFMGTISLVVLQALLLHIITIRDVCEPRVVWCLNGVAVRIAQSMGLERDGASVGLPLFEAEYRRRVWWLLKTHDFRTAELCGLAKFRDLDIGDDKAKWPTNINDDQLFPSMTSITPAPNSMTDTIFVNLRYELLGFAAERVSQFRGKGKPPNQWDLHATGNTDAQSEELSNALEELLETKYLRYCDPSQPLHLITMLMARYAQNVIRFLTHHPRRWASIDQIPTAERQWVWDVSIKLLEQHQMLQSSQSLKPFTWHAAYFRQWHAYIHVLDTLRADPLTAQADKAWNLIRGSYECCPELISDTRKPIHVAVGNLCLKAYSARETALQKKNMSIPTTPDFIVQLRRQREAARARRKARENKTMQSSNRPTANQETNSEVNPRPNTGVSYLSDTFNSTHLDQSATTIVPPLQSNPSLNNNNNDTVVSAGDELFWFTGHLNPNNTSINNNQTSQGYDLMNMDSDFTLSPDQIMEDNDTAAAQSINWEQWDAWLADSNAMHPLTST